ncbi:MAG: FecR domain-containing protein [Bacteroidales bacterium]|nr:FecR domain-containing protein [Bacteroidales bacterium]
MDDKIEELLVKKLDEGLTDLEEQELNAWLEESGEYGVIFREMRNVRLWMDTGKAYNPDIEFGLKKIKWRYHRMRMIRRMRYAAILIVCLTVGTLLWEYRRGQVNEEKILVSDEFIRTGAQQAFFVWADGTRVSLGKEIKDTLISGEGVAFLQIDSNQMLHYKGNVRQDNAKRFNQLIVPNGGEYRMLLEDGTIVWVNSASAVEIPEHFDDTERRVRLKGEAYFEVKPDVTRPFYVETEQACIQVLGTKFNISAYQDDLRVMTTLISGSVCVSNSGGKQVILVPGEQAVVFNEKISVGKVDPNSVISWVEGRFRFENARLEDIVKQIVRWYDVPVYFEKEDLKDIHFSGGMLKFRPLKDLVEMIELSSPVRFTMENEKIIISEK